LKILYISQYFPPEMGAPAGRVAELSHLWTDAGHDVTVLTGFPNHPTGVVPSEYRSKLRRLICHEQADGVQVVRTWLLPLPNRRAYERILNYSSFCLSAASTGMFLSQPDLVIATSPQLLVGLAGWWLARWNRVPFILEVRDLWPESLAAVDTASRESLLYRALNGLAGFLYRTCDRIVVVTSAFKERLVENWRLPAEKISVVENGVDTELFHPHAEHKEIRRALRAEGKFVVSYIGTMGLAHGLQTVLDAASQLQHAMPGVLFLFVGEGAEKQKIVCCARERGLNNVCFVDQQRREDVPAYICASDVCLVPLRKSELFSTVLPTKMLEFMACARPVILGVDGLARGIVQEANAGIIVEPENATDLAEAIKRLACDPALCAVFGRSGRNYVLRNFTRRHTAEAYLRVLEGLAEKPQTYAAAADSLTARL
jgi:glycosyltransferase involved in cell wall biosynthesis